MLRVGGGGGAGGLTNIYKESNDVIRNK